jgi:hypothetical protein
MTRHRSSLGFTLAAITTAQTGPALAGRPLTVDDAGTNASGEGHVEYWRARADGARFVNLSPAYALRDGLEISALLSRETPQKITTTALQMKVLLSPSKEAGCNFGVGVGVARARVTGDSETGSFVNGIATCNGTRLGNVHFNLGVTKPYGVRSVRNFGVALEREMGVVTPHVEYFGADESKPVVQIGVRGDVAKNLQLDGTFGRSAGSTGFSLGVKYKF